MKWAILHNDTSTFGTLYLLLECRTLLVTQYFYVRLNQIYKIKTNYKKEKTSYISHKTTISNSEHYCSQT